MSDQEHDSELNKEFLAACEDPDNFDFSFADKRNDENFANFGFDPEEAEKLQEEETTRILNDAGEQNIDYDVLHSEDEYDGDEDDYE